MHLCRSGARDQQWQHANICPHNLIQYEGIWKHNFRISGDQPAASTRALCTVRLLCLIYCIIVKHGDLCFRYNTCYTLLWSWSNLWPLLMGRTPIWHIYASLAIGARDRVRHTRGRGTDLRDPLSRVLAMDANCPIQLRSKRIPQMQDMLNMARM